MTNSVFGESSDRNFQYSLLASLRKERSRLSTSVESIVGSISVIALKCELVALTGKKQQGWVIGR